MNNAATVNLVCSIHGPRPPGCTVFACAHCVDDDAESRSGELRSLRQELAKARQENSELKGEVAGLQSVIDRLVRPDEPVGSAGGGA